MQPMLECQVIQTRSVGPSNPIADLGNHLIPLAGAFRLSPAVLLRRPRARVQCRTRAAKVCTIPRMPLCCAALTISVLCSRPARACGTATIPPAGTCTDIPRCSRPLLSRSCPYMGRGSPCRLAPSACRRAPWLRPLRARLRVRACLF
jgi:hypothetical protein